MALQYPISLLAAIALALSLPAAGVVAAERAGALDLARGIVSAFDAEAGLRLLGRGSEVFPGETISTGRASLARLKLADGTRVTLRPRTRFVVESFSVEPGREEAVLRLVRGGLRAVTGFISKRRPRAIRLRTAVATIGIRGTEFDARLCGADCRDEALMQPAAAGKVRFTRGNVLARIDTGDRTRALSPGDPVFAGEILTTGSGAYMVVVLRDNSRITLLPNTEFQIERLEYQAATPDTGRSVLRLLRGGLRAVSGIIGKRERRGFRLRTPVATIGIRGTGFDLYCQGSCVDPSAGAGPGSDGLYAEVWEGTIDFDDNYPTPQGNIVFLANPTVAPIAVTSMPIDIEGSLPPIGDIPDWDGAEDPNPPDGLYVSCYVGECDVETDENTVALANGEAGYVDVAGGPAAELDDIPAFQAADPAFNDGIGPLFSTEGVQCY